jgi:FkbM family methyltransferase
MEDKRTFYELKSDYESNFLTKKEYIMRAALCHDQLYAYSELIENSEIREIQIKQGDVLFIVGKEELQVYSPRGESRYAPLEILNFGAYEPFETQLLKILSVDASTIIDIGANIGWFSLNFAKFNELARIIAFEPLPSAYSYLERNVLANHLQNQIQIEKLALSDKTGINKFIQPNANSTNSSFINVANSENIVVHEVETTTIDNYFSSHPSPVELIKCDVEGSEFLVFSGGIRIVEKYKPAIFTEMLRKWSGAFGRHPNELIRLLENLGYECFEVNEATIRRIHFVNEETAATNFIFLSDSDNHKRLRNAFALNGWLE